MSKELLFWTFLPDFNWLMYAKALIYADDSTTSVSDKNILEVIRRLEIDALNVLRFMASNGSFANEKKTSSSS